MGTTISRRDFMASTAVAGLAAAAEPFAGSADAARPDTAPGGPAVKRQSVRPVVVASSNGHRFRNGGTKTCVEIAFEKMTQGSDVLDALIAGVNIVELDPLDNSVGYGGLPNADGVVQLDASVMHGPQKRCGCGGASRVSALRRSWPRPSWT